MKKLIFGAALAAVGIMSSGCHKVAPVHYPETKTCDTVDVYFGEEVADPYRWLENDTSAETEAWVAAENAVTQAYLQSLPMRDKLAKRMAELVNYETIGAPKKHHGKWYFRRHDGKQNQSVVYVKDSLDGEARVFLDPNTFSEDGTVALGGMAWSNDGKYMAYSISRNGSDWQEIYVMDLETGELLEDHIEWVKFSGATWHGKGFYYSTYDRPEEGKELSSINEGMKIFYHKIGTPQSEDRLFYSNPKEPQRFYGVAVNEEETLLFLIESGAGEANNLYVRDLRKPGSAYVTLADGMRYVYSPLYDEDNALWLYTTEDAPKGRIMKVDLNRPERKHWTEVIAEQENNLDAADVINRQLVVTYMKDACTHAYVYTMEGKLRHEVQLPMAGSAYFTGDEKEKECFFGFSSFTQPGTIYSYDIDANTYTLYSQPKVEFDPEQYVSEQQFFASKDGTRIPMFIVHKKSVTLDGQNPTLLYGYGGFNISLQPYFSSMLIPWLEQGGVYCMVNLRGGGEYGEEWHEAGTKMNKQNVFDDFIAAAEYMIAQGYTNPKKLAIMGGSNGGLLVGACMTQRPDLYQVAIPQVGVMDMLRYHLFTIGWNWAGDYGTSADSKEMFEYLRAYSPLHNIKPGVAYPATLITTADHDDRVVPAHSFKFAAMLQACQAGDQPCLIRIDTKAGHGGGKPLAKRIEEQADIYSFIFYNMGIRPSLF